MTRLISLLLLTFTGIQISAQSQLVVKNGCSVNPAAMGVTYYISDPTRESAGIIRAIMNTIGLEPNFIIKSGDVNHVLSTIDDGKRYFIYNTAFFEQINNNTITDWSIYFKFAHGIAHHLNNHKFDLKDPVERKEQERSADIFAGSLLYNLGASLKDVEAVGATACAKQESSFYPSRQARTEAIVLGWHSAQGKNPVQHQKIVLPKDSITNTVATKASDDPLGLVHITGGTFTMGCTDDLQDCLDNENPAHQVTVSDFYIGKYEVTRKLWQEIMGSNPFDSDNPGYDQCPVYMISWNMVQQFLKKINAKYPGWNYRLPTEAEWEYAAREGGKKVMFGNGKNVLDPAAVNFNASEVHKKPYSEIGMYRQRTTPVGTFPPNALGLYDMCGNVWELCSDFYGKYKARNQKNPTGPSSGFSHVFRGGSWANYPQDCKVTNRCYSDPDHFSFVIGFRLARSR